MDPTRHNYYKKLMRLRAAGEIPSGPLTEVDVAHDDWCAVYGGGYCNCDPDITVRAPSHAPGPTREQDSLTEVQPLVQPTGPCPHCGCCEFVVWQKPTDPSCRAISCNGCGAVMSSTHPLDPDDRPMRRP
jgi:hypothetical protein